MCGTCPPDCSFQLTRADETGGFIFSAALEGSLPSDEEDVKEISAVTPGVVIS